MKSLFLPLIFLLALARVNTWPEFGPGPILYGISPAQAAVGGEVEITGQGFTGTTAVTFNGNAAVFRVVDDRRIVAWVPHAFAEGAVEVWEGELSYGAPDSFRLGYDPGFVVIWGQHDVNGSKHMREPADLERPVMVAAGANFSGAIEESGRLRFWGESTEVPIVTGGGTNMALIVGSHSFVAGFSRSGEFHVGKKAQDLNRPLIRPSGTNRLVGVSLGSSSGLGLTWDGRVIGLGGWEPMPVPTGLRRAIAVACGYRQAAALHPDGTVTMWDKTGGSYLSHYTNVAGLYSNGMEVGVIFQAGNSPAPALIHGEGEIALISQEQHAMVREDGSFLASQTPPVWLKNAAQVAVGGSHFVALSRQVPTILPRKTDYDVVPGSLLKLGTLVYGEEPMDLQWYRNGSALAGQNERELVIPAAGTNETGEYVLVARSARAVGLSAPIRVRMLDDFEVWGVSKVGKPGEKITIFGRELTAATAVTFNGVGAIFRVLDGNRIEAIVPHGRIRGEVRVWVNEGHGKTLEDYDYEYPATQIMEWGYFVDPVPAGLTDAVMIGTGMAHTSALREDGSVVAWGMGEPGEGGQFSVGQSTVPAGATNVTTIATRSMSTLALREDGTMVGWPYPKFTPREAVPEGLGRVIAISTGELHDLALLTDGTVRGWGYNGDGQAAVPPGLKDVVAIAAGYSHSVALTREGKLITWGQGRGDFLESQLPKMVRHLAAGWNRTLVVFEDGTGAVYGDTFREPFSSQMTNLVSVEDGHQFTVGLTTGGELKVWGQDSTTEYPPEVDGVLQIGAEGSRASVLFSHKPVFTLQPVSLKVVSGQPVVLRAEARGADELQWYLRGSPMAGETNSTLALPDSSASAGEFWLSAKNGAGGTESAHVTITRVPAPVIRSVAPMRAGVGRAVYIRGVNLANATAVTFNGNAAFFAVEGDDTIRAIVPQAWASGQVAVFVNDYRTTSAERFDLGVMDGGLVGWGGVRSDPLWVPPGLMDLPAGLEGVRLLSAPDDFQFMLLENGHYTKEVWGYRLPPGTNIVYFRGSTFNGVFLQENGAAVHVFETRGYQISSNAVQVATMIGAAMAVTESGEIAVRKFALPGAVLPGTEMPPGLTNVIALDSSYHHAIALRADGRVIAWGYDNARQTRVPAALADVAAIAAGYEHNLALRRDGTVVAWGRNDMGQCNVPAELQGRAVQVAAGFKHSYGLDRDGKVYAWGGNDNKQLDLPEGLGRVSAIEAGFVHALAVAQLPVQLSPGNGTGVEGEPFEFHATSIPGAQYEWFHGGVRMDEDNEVLAIPEVTDEQAGMYSVRVVSNGGTGRASARLQVRKPPVLSGFRVDRAGEVIQFHIPGIGTTGPTWGEAVIYTSNKAEGPWVPLTEGWSRVADTFILEGTASEEARFYRISVKLP